MKNKQPTTPLEERAIYVTVKVIGEKRIAAMDSIRKTNHSSRNAVLNVGLDLVIENQARLETLCAEGMEEQ